MEPPPTYGQDEIEKDDGGRSPRKGLIFYENNRYKTSKI